MKKKDIAKQRHLAKKWSPGDLTGITSHIELGKEQSICSLTNVIEIIEILELLRGMQADFPEYQQRYFREAADELITLAIVHLEKLRTVF